MNEPIGIAPELLRAAERWGTPLYVTDLDAAAARAAAWRTAVPNALLAYAIKANSDPALLSRLADDGCGFEVVGPVELALARRAGCPPARLVVNGVGQTDGDLVEALAGGALVNAETLGGLEALLRAGTGRIGIRVNPALDAGTHPHLATGAAGSKFGIGLDELPEAFRRVRAAGVSLVSIGAHIGSDIGDTAAFATLAQLLAQMATENGVAAIDMGGGFAGEPAAWAAAVLPHLPPDAALVVEPGRSVVAGAGWLVTRVVRVQRGHLVADAGMTELIRPMLYGARHPVSVLAPGRDARAGRWTVSGPVCEAGDVLADGVELEAGEGALLAFAQAGAYGAAMASNYNGRLRPAEAVVEGGTLRLSRRRETLEDLVARNA